MATNWLPATMTVSELYDRLSTPQRGKETLEVFLGMKKKQQDARKDIGGFVGGNLTGRRKAVNLKGRDVITLDLDSIPGGCTDEVIARMETLGCSYAMYSTRKHRPSAPRLRAVVPTDRTMTVDEYEPCARRLAELIQTDMNWFDPTTFEVERLMYWPSCCADGEYVFRCRKDLPLLRADELLGAYRDWHSIALWPRVPGEVQVHQRAAAKQGDPTEKEGIVGAFCRVYDVPAAMDAFLPGVYEPVDGSDDRYTFAGGSTSGGALLYQAGKFLYSHHATDPCSGKLVNAFDLVRLHLFSAEDELSKEGTPTHKRPSYKQMCQLARSDAEVAALAEEERGAKLMEEFGDRLPQNTETVVSAESDKSAVIPSPAPYPEVQMRKFLGGLEGKELTTALVRETMDAVGVRCQFDEITHRTLLSGAERFGWSKGCTAQNMPVYLRDILRPAGVVGASTSAIAETMDVIADLNRFNPVRAMLENTEWDGADRLEVLFELIGITEQPFCRTLVHKWLRQCVALGCNTDDKPCGADGVLVLQGDQGIGKTSVVRRLAVRPEWFCEGASFGNFKDKDKLIQATNAWITELGEIERTLGSTSDLKAFITNTSDAIRKPYARTAVEMPRRTSFCGTVNPGNYLVDPTGNRRFWTVHIERVDLNRLFSLTDDWFVQLWAQIYADWQTAGAESYRLTAAEQQALSQRNQDYEEPLTAEIEIRDLMDFSLEEKDWRLCRASFLASLSGARTDARQVGRVLRRLMRDYPAIRAVRKKDGQYFQVPLAKQFAEI